MKIQTKAFGEIEVSEKQKILFKNGIFGFEDIRNFILIDNDEGSPFYWLQAENYPETAFVVIDPFLVDNSYKLDIPDKDVEELQIKAEQDVLIFSIVTINKNPNDITVNLLGPIIINKNTHEARQIINKQEYSIKHPLLKKQEEKC